MLLRLRCLCAWHRRRCRSRRGVGLELRLRGVGCGLLGGWRGCALLGVELVRMSLMGLDLMVEDVVVGFAVVVVVLISWVRGVGAAFWRCLGRRRGLSFGTCCLLLWFCLCLCR